MSDDCYLDYAFKVAIGGALGYEFNALKIDSHVKDIIKSQIEEYRQYENLILNGEFYRVFNPVEDFAYAYYFTNFDKS
ncbi:MAG: alpha-galactosidase [Clostridia bacterium]|nr:alpha-galactosidase [Clostridia bacterium]